MPKQPGRTRDQQASTPPRLELVVQAVLAVAAGAQSAVTIAEQLGLPERQGRQLRDLAVELGLIELDAEDQARVTNRGARVLTARDELQRKARLRHAIRQVPGAQQILAYLEPDPRGCTIRKLEDVVAAERTSSSASLEQRARMLAAWLQEVGLIIEEQGVVRLAGEGH